MKVSVVMITYNHEQFITQAVASAVEQEVNFDYEIVIGEDCGTDRTREILLELAKKHPDKIRLLLHEKNLGANRNFITTIQAAKGEYIAVLDGDDYWTSPHKLQKQVDFLDHHPECVICFHNALAVYSDKSRAEHALRPANQKAISTIEDLFAANFIPACSEMYRREVEPDLPAWYYSLKIGDWPHHILKAQHGKIGYINEVMATYRIHRGGTWSAKNDLSRLRTYLEMFALLNVYLGYNYDRLIRAKIASYCLDMAAVQAELGDIASAKRYLSKSISDYPTKQIRWLDMAVLMGRLYTPQWYNLLKFGWPSQTLKSNI
jgi:glycosyltransferase involved in cell wall biosynthesis